LGFAEPSYLPASRGGRVPGTPLFRQTGAPTRGRKTKLQAVRHEHGPTGRYIVADRPLTEEEWIKEVGATVIDVTPEDE
jgi:hypothetical protein